MEAVFVKFGGSLITEKRQEATPRLDVIERLAAELRAAMDAKPDMRLVLGHGSGSFGHFAAKRYGVHTGLAGASDWMGMAQTSAAAARLNRLVADVCLQAGVPAISFQPSASALRKGGVLAEMATGPVSEALGRGLVPLVYGDVAFDSDRGSAIISTEDIFLYLARSIIATRVLMLGMVDGVYESDPLRDPQSRRIPSLTPEMVHRIRGGLGGSHGVDVTGGMLGKVTALLPLLQNNPGLSIHFFSGDTPGRLRDALLERGEPFGTVLRAESQAGAGPMA